MSKVKIRNEHLARKAVRENRRYETTRKKEERLKKAQNNEYPFLIGYYVIDTRVSYQKKKVVVPEHTETRWVLVEKEIQIHGEPPMTKVTGFVRSLKIKFPPDCSGNPYSYRRVHYAATV